MGQPEGLVDGVALGLLERDLELRPARRGLSLEKFLDGHLEGMRQRLEQRQLRFAFSVLQEGELRGSPADAFAQVREGIAPLTPEMAQPLSKDGKVYTTRQDESFFALQGRHALM